MSVLNHCDATGVEIPEDTPTTGHHGRQYSDEARPIAEQYLRELDEIHTVFAVAFQAKLTELRAKYREKIRELPDDMVMP